MSLNESSNDPRVDAVRERYARNRQRFFMSYAVGYGLVLVATVLVVFVFELIPEEFSMIVLFAVVVIGGVIMVGYTFTSTRNQYREIAQLTGKPPLP